MKKTKTKRAWEILSLPIRERTLLRQEFWELIIDVLEDTAPWLKREVSNKIFFSYYQWDSIEVAEVTQAIQDEVIDILISVSCDKETRKGLAPDPQMSIEDYIRQVVKKRNLSRKYRNKYKVGEMSKDQNSLQSSERKMLVLGSFDSIEELRERTLLSSNTDGVQENGIESAAEKYFGLVKEDSLAAEYEVSKHVKGLDDVTKMAFLLTEWGAVSSINDIVKTAREVGVRAQTLARYVKRLKNVLSLRSRKNLTRADIATVLDINPKELKRQLNCVYAPELVI